MSLTQRDVINQYVESYIDDFNPELFRRSDDEIIENLKKAILSCQRDYGFILKVNSFTVIDDYQQIQDVLYMYDERYNEKKRNKKNPNPYGFIDIKDSDLRLLIVNYYIEVNGKYEYVDVIIAIPRVVNDYYFRINGKLCYAQYQISDVTYNNASSSNKKKSPIVTSRTLFTPIKLFNKKFKLLTPDKEEMYATYFITKVFNKIFGCYKYILAKFGLYGTIEFMGYEGFIYILDKYEPTETEYVFEKNGIFIYVDKMVFDADDVLQSLVCNIYQSIYKDTKYCDFFSHDYWLRSLGREFNIDSEEKGLQLLVSLESSYDIKTREILRLPEEDKATIYHNLRWSMREFNELMNKSNMDLSYKRLRRPEEYIAAFYASKMYTGLYRITNSNKKGRMTTNTVKKAVCNIPPLYLVTAISKCNLVEYRSLVHDLDSLVVLDASFGGVSGLSDEMGSISESMRFVDLTHLGRLDLDSSRKSSPGISISLTPTCEIYEHGYFSEFEEPNTWRNKMKDIMDSAKELQGLRDVITFEQDVLGKDNFAELKNIDTVMQSLSEPIYFVDTSTPSEETLIQTGQMGYIGDYKEEMEE